ncbi:MAG: class I SAM-dependent methyltransferase [Magnetococcales bacterium]|nr:class I SAM-dependent methyltransferase [Magnetococcales bacterium]MBF0418901.1 class I SAM-dependent methyltransferase [Magnetococcales bacterium]
MDRQNYITMAAVQERHWWFRGRRAILGRVFARLKLPENAPILDAGCGPGPNLQMLAQYGRVWGMEYDDYALEHAKKISDATLAQGFLPYDIPFAGQKFHLVTLLDVLSCIESDKDAIQALAERIEPGGWLVITAPAYNFLWSSHDVASHHYRRYTISRLKDAVAPSGLTIHFTSYFNSILFLPIFLIRLMKRWLSILEGDDSGVVPSVPINQFLYGLLRLESALLGYGLVFPFGVSVLLVAHKPVSDGSNLV